MNCPRCGNRTRVTNSRTIDSGCDQRNKRIIQWAIKTASWYTQDWTVRNRRCEKCKWESLSIELLQKDYEEMRKIWKTEQQQQPQGGDNE